MRRIFLLLTSLFSLALVAKELTDFVVCRDGLPSLVQNFDSQKDYGISMFGNRAFCQQASCVREKIFPFAMQHYFFENNNGALCSSIQYYITGLGRGFVLLDTLAEDVAFFPDQNAKSLAYLRAAIPVRRDVVLLYSPPDGFPEVMETEQYRKTRAYYDEFAEKNGFPSLDLAGYLYQEVTAGRIAKEKCQAIHNEKGDAVKNPLFYQYADKMLTELLKKSAQRRYPAALLDEIYQKRTKNISRHKMVKVSYEIDSYPSGWLPWQFSPCTSFLHLLNGTGTAIYEFPFYGSAIAVSGILSADSGAFEFSIDGAPWSDVTLPERPTRGIRFYEYILAENLDKKQQHVLKLRLKEAGKKTQIGTFLIADYRDTNPPGSLAFIDQLYKRMPRVDFTPTDNLLEKLPRTKARLENGPSLSILMLGDSIINDIVNSNFQLLLSNMYPKCPVSLVVSVRGSTGCWYYKEEKPFKTFVADKKFDLVVIGGISQYGDVDSIRIVIEKILQMQPEVEIILMPGVWGSKVLPKNGNPPSPTDPDYHGKLCKLAMDFPGKAAFCDIRTPWIVYLRKNAIAPGAFMRDTVHANDYGKQLIGRIIEIYFAPAGYDPWQNFLHRLEKSASPKEQ